MNYCIFTVLVMLVYLIILFILRYKKFNCYNIYAAIILFLITIGTVSAFRYNCEKGDLKYSYDLINLKESDYITLTGNRSIRPAVMYIDSDNELHVHYIDTCTILKDDGKSRIDFYEYNWGFLKGSRSEVYINDIAQYTSQ